MRLSANGLILTLTFAIGFLVAPLAAEAQHTGKVSHVGILSFFSPEPSPGGEATTSRLGQAPGQALPDRGYVEGQNIRFEWRSADRRVDRLRDLASELVRLRVDVIVAVSDDAIGAAQRATPTIPIVMAGVNDPVALGFVKSLAHPGGN